MSLQYDLRRHFAHPSLLRTFELTVKTDRHQYDHFEHPRSRTQGGDGLLVLVALAPKDVYENDDGGVFDWCGS
jgi:hypothetical protein